MYRGARFLFLRETKVLLAVVTSRPARVRLAMAREPSGQTGMEELMGALIWGWFVGGIFIAGLWAAQAQAAPDVAKAEALMKKSGCNKCHALSAKKEGPPYKETAAKYKGKADGADKLFTHLTTNPKVKVEGKEELHDSLKTKNDADVKNVVEYILSR